MKVAILQQDSYDELHYDLLPVEQLSEGDAPNIIFIAENLDAAIEWILDTLGDIYHDRRIVV